MQVCGKEFGTEIGKDIKAFPLAFAFSRAVLRSGLKRTACTKQFRTGSCFTWATLSWQRAWKRSGFHTVSPCRHSPSSRKPPGLTLRLGFHTPAPAAAMALPAEIPNYGSVGLQCWHLPTQPQTCSFLLRASCRHPIGTAVNHPCPRTDLCSWPASEIFPPTNPWEPPRAPFNNLRCHYVKQKWY